MNVRGHGVSSVAAGVQLVTTAMVLGVLWILPGCFSGLHESDQAAVLGDAWHLSGGGSWQPTVLYNYDKLFMTDWLLRLFFGSCASLARTTWCWLEICSPASF
jgi:hypothetical protein